MESHVIVAIELLNEDALFTYGLHSETLLLLDLACTQRKTLYCADYFQRKEKKKEGRKEGRQTDRQTEKKKE